MTRQPLLTYTENTLLGRYILRRGKPEENLMIITEVYPFIRARAVKVYFRGNQTIETTLKFPHISPSGRSMDKEDFESYVILDDKEAKRILKKIKKLESLAQTQERRKDVIDEEAERCRKDMEWIASNQSAWSRPVGY